MLSLAILFGAMTTRLMAQEMKYDIKDEVEVLGTRPGEKTPVTQHRIKVDDLTKKSIAWDVPTLLQGTPSLVLSSDGGIMGGYTSFTIRGVDASRINITNMGVPLNDSESQTVFWQICQTMAHALMTSSSSAEQDLLHLEQDLSERQWICVDADQQEKQAHALLHIGALMVSTAIW